MSWWVRVHDMNVCIASLLWRLFVDMLTTDCNVHVGKSNFWWRDLNDISFNNSIIIIVNKLSWFSCISHYVRQRAIQIASRFCKRTFIRAKEKFAMFFFATLSPQIFFAANNTIPGCFPTSLRSLAVCTNAKFNPPEPVKP